MKETRVFLPDLIICLSDAMDFISQELVNHHKQVAYIASCIASEMGLPAKEQKEIMLAGALHDVGAFSLKERLDMLSFEVDEPYEHAEMGYRLLKVFVPLEGVASIVRFHHTPWDNGAGAEFRGYTVPVASHILHLSDRIAVLVNRKQEVLGQVRKICRAITSGSGRRFMPDLVDVFINLASKEYFWLDLVSNSLSQALASRFKSESMMLGSKDLLGFSRLFSRIIDFKSPFTATHSSGVAATSEFLAGLLGFSDRDRFMMRIAGYLHDIGKLAVPVEILNKPAKLAPGEVNIVRHHAFYTHRILQSIPSLSNINEWASLHHERLDGSGYPFHLSKKNLSTGSQIMAVADVFTAITENRPYRAGMMMDNALKILKGMAETSALNKGIVSKLENNYEEIDFVRIKAQTDATHEYNGLKVDKRSSRLKSEFF